MAGYEFFKTRDISKLARKCNDEGKNECNVYNCQQIYHHHFFKNFVICHNSEHFQRTIRQPKCVDL